MNLNPTDLVVVGRCGAPHGVKGWVKVNSFTDPTANILDFANWLVNTGSSWLSIEVAEVKQQQNLLAVRFVDVIDRNAAANFTNMEIAVKRSELPELASDDFYWNDLVGLDVLDQKNQHLGKVKELFNSGAHDIMIVKSDTQEHLIPFVQDVHVMRVDLAVGVVHVDWDLVE